MTAFDTGTEDLRAEIDGGVAVITMNRPDRRNAFSPAMVSALGTVLAQVETDDAVGCVVLTGAGGAFCAGGDVKNMAATPADRGDGTGPSLDARIHRQRAASSKRVHQRRRLEHAQHPYDRPPSGGLRPGPGLRWRWSCDLRYAVPGAVLTSGHRQVASAGDVQGRDLVFSPGWWAAAKPKSSTTSPSPG